MEITKIYKENNSNKQNLQHIKSNNELIDLLDKIGFKLIGELNNTMKKRFLVATSLLTKHQLLVIIAEDKNDEMFKKDYKELLQIKHSNFNNINDVFTKNLLYAITDFCDLGNLNQLEEYIKSEYSKYKIEISTKEKHAYINLNLILYIISNVMKNHRKLAHLNITPNNILFSKNDFRIKLHALENSEYINSQALTLKQKEISHLPVECFNINNRINNCKKADIYSISLILDKYIEVYKENINVQDKKLFNEVLKIYYKMKEENSNNRISHEEIKNSSFIISNKIFVDKKKIICGYSKEIDFIKFLLEIQKNSTKKTKTKAIKSIKYEKLKLKNKKVCNLKNQNNDIITKKNNIDRPYLD